MADIVVKCGKCGADVAFTDSLAAPLIEATKAEYEKKLAAKNEEILKKDKEMKSRQSLLEKAESDLDATIERRLKEEKAKISAAEAKKASVAVQEQLNAQQAELDESKQLLKSRTDALEKAKKEEAELRKQKRALEEEKLAMDATIQERVDEELKASKNTWRIEIEREANSKIRQKDLQLESMQTEIDNLKRKSEQGSQQLQGDATERELIEVLQQNFPNDKLDRVPKGVSGGDCIQKVYSNSGKFCGTILWESKQTKNWGKDWLKKLKQDQMGVKADVSILISNTLPEEVVNFAQVEGVWVTGWSCLIPVASSLRHLLTEVSATKRSNEGHKDKAELIYQYVTSGGFKQGVQAMVDTFTAMEKDLQDEKKAISKQWAKRQAQLTRMTETTMALWGEFQGIAGQSVPELEGIGFNALESGE